MAGKVEVVKRKAEPVNAISYKSSSGIKLRDYQNAAVDAIWNGLAEREGNVLAVLPTGTGKAMVLCEFIKRAVQAFPQVRIICLTFSKELVQQNFLEMMNLWPECKAGIHSAGLKSRDVKSQVVFGSIQSIYKKALDLQQADLIIVDEAQAIPRNADTMWLKFFAEVKQINPDVRIVGLTATAFRLDSGMLHKGDGAMFSHIVYEYSLIEAIKEGYLSQPISQSSATQIDTSHVPIRGGEFLASSLDAAASDPETVAAIADEVVEKGQDRKAWIIFGSGIKTCTLIRDAIRERGYTCEGVFATTPGPERDAIIAAFKKQEIRCLVSVVALTTGFNVPAVDLVGLARPTQSVGLYIQSCGRGTRPVYAKGYDLGTREGRLAAIAAGPKPNCLILDWGGNVRRHGLLDQPQVKEKAGDGSGSMPVKVCGECGADNFIAARECSTCGAPFLIVGSKITTRASTGPLLSTQIIPEWIKVDTVRYARHNKPDKPTSMRVSYQCGLTSHSEWICFNHTGYARQKAEAWWAKRAPAPIPKSVDEAIARTNEIKKPTEIHVKPVGKFVELLGARFE